MAETAVPTIMQIARDNGYTGSADPETVVEALHVLAEVIGSADPEDIAKAVSDWLDAHPEATTTVTDGSITKAKLAADYLTTAQVLALYE